jgi:hypothetical protein
MSRARHIARKRGGGVPHEDKASPKWNAGEGQNAAKEAEEKKSGGAVARAEGGFVKVRAHKRARGGHVADGAHGETHHHVKPRSMRHHHGMKVPGRARGGSVPEKNPISGAGTVKHIVSGELPEEGSRSK